MKNELKKYAEGLGATDSVIKWIAAHVPEQADQSEAEHVIDFLNSDKAPKRLARASYEAMKIATEKWVKAMNKKGAHVQESDEDVEVIQDWGDGFRMVRLVGKAAYEREGFLMRHCASSYFEKKDAKVYSLRDQDNQPHATIEWGNQIKGKGNGSISPKYIKYIVEFMESQGMEMRDSEMENLGYVDITQVTDKNAVFSPLFREKWFYEKNKIVDKNGKEYHSISLWKVFRPFSLDSELKIQWRFNLDLSIKTFLANIKKSLKKEGSGDYSSASNSGNYSSASNSGDHSSASNSGYHSSASNSGDQSSASNSGYQSSASNSGYQSSASNSGNYSSASNSGDHSSASNSGDHSSASNSGDHSSASNSGYHSSASNSGNYSSASNSGNYSSASNSGNYSSASNSGYQSSASNSGDQSSASNSGDQSSASNSGDHSSASNSGDHSSASNSGDHSSASNSGYHSSASNSGNYSSASNSGNYSSASNSGDQSSASNSGDQSSASNSGNYSSASVEKKDSVATVTGGNSRAKGVIGSWLVLTERRNDWTIIEVRAVYVDGKKIAPDTWHELKGGQVVPVPK